MNLLYCGNRGVLDGIALSALSVAMGLKTTRKLRIHILTMDLTGQDEAYTPITAAQGAVLERGLRRHNPDTAVTVHDVTDLYARELGGSPNENCYCSPYTLLRLLADRISLPEKVLYLDADVLACGDLSRLYHMDISGFEYAAAADHYGKFWVHPGYINAGVLLLNMKKCRETGLFPKARSLIWARKLPFADQSALIRATTSRKLLDRRFNEQRRIRPDTVLRHYAQRLYWLPYPHTVSQKPWRPGFREPGTEHILAEFAPMKEDPHWTP